MLIIINSGKKLRYAGSVAHLLNAANLKTLIACMTCSLSSRVVDGNFIFDLELVCHSSSPS